MYIAQLAVKMPASGSCLGTLAFAVLLILECVLSAPAQGHGTDGEKPHASGYHVRPVEQKRETKGPSFSFRRHSLEHTQEAHGLLNRRQPGDGVVTMYNCVCLWPLRLELGSGHVAVHYHFKTTVKKQPQ